MNFECHCILHEFLIRDGHYFYVSNWRWDRHFTWSCEPLKGLGACSAKGIPLLLSYFLTPCMSIDLAPGIHHLPHCNQALYQLS